MSEQAEEITLPSDLQTDFTGTNATKKRQMLIRHAIREARNVIIANTRKCDERASALQCLVYAKALAETAATATAQVARAPLD